MIAIAKSLSAVTANDIMRDTITSQADVAIRQSAIKRDIISLLTDKHGIPAIGSISGGNGLINHIAYNIIGCELQSRSSHSTLLASEKGKLGKNCDLLYDKISRTKDVMAVAKDIANVTKNEAAQAVISESATRRCDEIKSGLSFNDKGSLAKFLNSGSPKNLAAEIDRNMKNNHLLLDADLSKDKKAAEYLPENMRRQMEEVGKELQVRLDERATFSGKIKQKAENFAATVVNLPAIVINSLRKLVHLGEESLLSSACQECHYKVHGINLDLNRESQKPSGKFADAEVAKKSQLQTTHHEK